MLANVEVDVVGHCGGVMHGTRQVSNAEVSGTGCLPFSHLATNRHLQLFSHIARSSMFASITTEPLQQLSDKYRPTGSVQ